MLFRKIHGQSFPLFYQPLQKRQRVRIIRMGVKVQSQIIQDKTDLLDLCQRIGYSLLRRNMGRDEKRHVQFLKNGSGGQHFILVIQCTPGLHRDRGHGQMLFICGHKKTTPF